MVGEEFTEMVWRKGKPCVVWCPAPVGDEQDTLTVAAGDSRLHPSCCTPSISSSLSLDSSCCQVILGLQAHEVEGE